MRKSIKASSLVAGVILAGVASPALAEEVTTTTPVTTPVVSDQNQTVTQEMVDSAKTSVEIANSDVSKQQAIVDTANQAVTDATTEVENASNALATANADAATATPEAIKAAEETVKTTQEDLNKAIADQKKADEAVASAQEAVTNKEKDVDDASKKLRDEVDAKNKAEKAVTDAETALKNAESEVPTIKLSEEYINTLKQRVEYMGDTTKGVNNSIDLGNATHVQNDAALKRIGEDLFNQNTYKNTTDTDKKEVDLWNMTDEQRKEVNQFALAIVNNVRSQFGSKQLVTTQGMLNFATDVANNRSRTYLGHDGAEYAVINNAAQKNGLSTYESEIGGLDEAAKNAWITNEKDKWWNTQARQGNVVVPTKLRTEDKEKFGRTDSPDPNYQKPPVMTMGELKEEIYKGFKIQLFNDIYTGNRAKRNWEVAASLVGLGYGENVTQFSSSISVAQQSGSYEWKGVTQYYKFYSIFVNNFMIRDPQEDIYQVNTIVDPSKFDANVLTDSSQQKIEAAKVALNNAEEAKKTATKAVTDAEATLKNAKTELAELQKTLETLQATAKNAKNTVASKQDAFDTAEATQTRLQGVAENLKKAQDAADAANEKKKLAEQTLQEANNKLAKLEESYKLAKENYEKILKLYEASQPIINSKGEQVPPTHSLPEAKIELKEVAFKTVYENDPTIELGKEEVLREGQNGSVQVITIGDQVTEIVLTEKVDKLVKRGTLVK
ncbi:TPA: SEC10/PgrA surface exclusion domain-containing protein, partial [Streptococcus suis]